MTQAYLLQVSWILAQSSAGMADFQQHLRSALALCQLGSLMCCPVTNTAQVQVLAAAVLDAWLTTSGCLIIVLLHGLHAELALPQSPSCMCTAAGDIKALHALTK